MNSAEKPHGMRIPRLVRFFVGPQFSALQRLAMILTHASSLFGLLHPIASIVSQGGPPE